MKWLGRFFVKGNLSAVGAAVLVVVVTQAPRVALYWLTPGNHVFLGSAWGAYDSPPYLQALGDGASGYWLFDGARSVGGVTGGYLLYTPYLLFGHLLGWTGLGPAGMLEAMRWITLPIVLIACWMFVRSCLSPGLRGFGYLAGLLLGGVGFLALARPITPLGVILPLDVSGPSFTVANGLNMDPHVGLSIAGLAIFGWGMVEVSNGRIRGAWGAPALLAVATFHAFVVPMVLVAASVFAFSQVRSRLAISYLALGYLLSAPILLYVLWLRIHDPLIASWGVDASDQENLISILVARAWLWPFVVIGAWHALRSDDLGPRFCLCWALAALSFELFPPLSTSPLHRTVEGSSLAVGVLAAVGALDLVARWRFYLVAAAFISPVIQSVGIVIAFRGDPYATMWRSDNQALVWLNVEAGRKEVISSTPNRRWILALSDATPGSTSLAGLVATPEDARAAMLRNNGSPMVFWGHEERLEFGPPPAGLTVRKQFGETEILTVPGSQ